LTGLLQKELYDAFVDRKQILSANMTLPAKGWYLITLLFEGGTLLTFAVSADQSLESYMVSSMIEWLDGDLLIEIMVPIIFGVVALVSYIYKRRQT
jgi:hypothetical protein